MSDKWEKHLVGNGATANKFDLSDALVELGLPGLGVQVREVESERDFWLERIIESINIQILNKGRILLVRETELPLRYWLILTIYDKRDSRFSRFLVRFMTHGGDFEGFLERWHGCFELSPSKLKIKSSSFANGGIITKVVQEAFERLGFEILVEMHGDI